MPPSEAAELLDPTYHPLWAAGITGANQVVGCGDSGVGECRHLGCVSSPTGRVPSRVPGGAPALRRTANGCAPRCRPHPADILHCFFVDPNVDLSSSLSYEDGVKTFNSPTHRKIRCGSSDLQVLMARRAPFRARKSGLEKPASPALAAVIKPVLAPRSGVAMVPPRPQPRVAQRCRAAPLCLP